MTVYYYLSLDSDEPVSRDEWLAALSLGDALQGNTFVHKASNVPSPGDVSYHLLDPVKLMLSMRDELGPG